MKLIKIDVKKFEHLWLLSTYMRALKKKAYIKKVNKNVIYHEHIQVKNNILLKVVYHH